MRFWELPEDKFAIIPARILSYNHLPSRLKPCFAYCVLFPKDNEIEQEKQIELWLAKGFIVSPNEKVHTRDIGNEYLNNLLW